MHKVAIIILAIIVMMNILALNANATINLEIQGNATWNYIEVDIDKIQNTGYITNVYAFKPSLKLKFKKIDCGFSYEKLSWERDFVGVMDWSPPLPEEQIHEHVTSKILALSMAYKWPKRIGNFTPYLGGGILVNYISSYKIGQTTMLRYTSSKYPWVEFTILGGMKIPIIHSLCFTAEVEHCISWSKVVNAADAYLPVYYSPKFTLVSLGVGYQFSLPIQ